MKGNFFKALFILSIVATCAYALVSYADHSFKGAICRYVDKEECEKRYKAYQQCIEYARASGSMEKKLAKEFCFKAAFFEPGVDHSNEHNRT